MKLYKNMILWVIRKLDEWLCGRIYGLCELRSDLERKWEDSE